MPSSCVILYHRQPHNDVPKHESLKDDALKTGARSPAPPHSPNGILPTLKQFFSHVDCGIWIAAKAISPGQSADFTERIIVDGKINVRRIGLSSDDIHSFYHITSKEACWPLLHSMPGYFTSATANWATFQRINALFAKAACEEAAHKATVWVHDYNLWLAPLYIRQQRPDVCIAFFHHTPFPAADMFNILPWREDIIDSLLCCNVLGFHLPRYAENFVGVARSLREIKNVKRSPIPPYMSAKGRALSEPMVPTQVGYQNRVVTIDTLPVGVDVERIRIRLAQTSAHQEMAQMRQAFSDQKIIIAVGRVDYVKGYSELLACYERGLECHPAWQGTVSLLLICVPPTPGMRIYQLIQADIEQSVGRINGRFSRLHWHPVTLFSQHVPFNQLVCWLKVADICWITPLRDGLNLVCKEYVAAHKGEDGVLILSEFAGASVELNDALITNPYSTEQMDQTLAQALSMSLPEQRQRMQQMYEVVTNYDGNHWISHWLRLFKGRQDINNFCR